MTYAAVAIAVLLTLHLVFTRMAKVPTKYKDLDTPRLRSLLEGLYVRGLEGAYLDVAVIDSDRFIRVYKHIRGIGDVELKAHVPKLTYDEIGLGLFQGAVADYGFRSALGTGSEHGNPDDLLIECGAEVSRALILVEFLLHRVMRLDPERECVAYVARAHPNPNAHPGFATAPTP